MAWGYLFFVVVYKQIKMVLHAGSRIPIIVQSFISISYVVFLSKLNNKNDVQLNYKLKHLSQPSLFAC